MSSRTLDNCSLIKRNMNKGLGVPRKNLDDEKCLGYHYGDMDELWDKCKECKLCESYEGSNDIYDNPIITLLGGKKNDE